jgi:hypothetical protein
MFDRVITNQRRYGMTIYSAMARGDRREEQRRQLQEQRAAADTRTAATAPEETARANDGTNATAATRPMRPVVANEAKLIPRPRCLYELWQEYQFGIGNNKAAKNFTSAERNNKDQGIKQKYHYRSKIWKLQSYMINIGWLINAMNT